MAELIVLKIDEENEALHVLLGDGMPVTYPGWLRDRSDEITHTSV